MLDVTVKTLDSQNHNYSVPDDITVEDFKEKISSSVNVPANLQRLIYCGRVLLDEKKLNDYDVNGKVVHLVQRPPPALSNRPDNQSSSIPSTTTFPRLQNTRHFTTPDGNQVYVGAFSIPTDNEDQIAPNLPFTPVVSLGQSSSAVRLNQAKKMLQKCNRILDVLGNENSEPEAESPAAEESFPEVSSEYSTGRWRVTNYAYPSTHQLVLAAQATAIASAVQAARAAGIPNITIVQGSSAVPSMVSSNAVSDSNVQTMQVDVESTSFSEQAQSDQSPSESVASGAEVREASGETECAGAKPKRLQTRNNDATESTSGSRSPVSNETTPASGEANIGNEQPSMSNSDAGTGDRLSGHPPTSRMVEVLDLLRSVNDRLQPYLQEYYSLMQTDPANNNDSEQQKNQSTFNKVSEILHYLSHAYHAISDIMCDFTLPPPRQLRGRPFVVQQPIMDSTIPIQFDAHINVTATNNSGDIDGRGPNGNQEQQSQVPSSHNPGVMVMEVNSEGGTQESGSPASIANGVTSGPQLLQQIIQMMRGGSIGMSISNGASDVPLAQQGQTTQARSGSETTSTASTRTRTTARPHIQPMAIPLPVPSNVYDPFLQCTSRHWFPADNNNGSSRQTQTNPVIGATIDIHPVLNFFHGRQDLRNSPRVPFGGLSGSSEQPRTNDGTSPSHISNSSQSNTTNSAQSGSPTLNRQEGTQAGDATTGQVNGSNDFQALHRQVQDIFQYMEGNLNRINVRHSMRVHSDPPRSGNTISVSLNAADGINIQRQDGGNSEAASHFPTAINNIVQDMFGQTEQMTQIAQQLFRARDSSNGDNLVDLIGNISLPDIDNILSGNFESLTPLQGPLRTYIRDRILHGQDPTESNIHQGMQGYVTEWRRWIQIAEREARQQVSGPSPLDNIDFTATMENFLLSQSTQAIRSLFSPVNAEGLGTSFLTQLQTFSDQMIALCLHFFNNSRNVLMVVMERFLDIYIRGRGQLVTQIANLFVRPRVQNLNLEVSAPMSEIEGYFVPRNAPAPTPSTDEVSDLCDNMEVDSIVPDSLNSRTESWQAVLPTDWVPIINQDICHHRRHSSGHQAPFSDAYLEGMPSKRRKMAIHKKPRESLNRSLSGLVRMSIRHLGLTPTTSEEQVAKDIVNNSELNQSFDRNLKSMIGERIKKDDNYLPSKYPFTEDYIDK